MAGQYALVVEGIEALQDFESLPQAAQRAASMAVNRTLDRLRTSAAREVRKQVNLPASYVSPAQGRLAVSRRASPSNPEGSVRARGRATSLARFVTNRGAKPGEVTAMVKPGGAVHLKRAWLIKLRSGPNSDNLGNLGLAIRLKPGETLRNRHLSAKPIFPNVYLLYGPSTYQLVNNLAEEKLGPDAASFLEDEFLRLLDI